MGVPQDYYFFLSHTISFLALSAQLRSAADPISMKRAELLGDGDLERSVLLLAI
jgi:hypothetical protein